MAEKKTWDRIARIVEEAEEHEGAEREGYLNEACAGDEELRREVDSLLRVDTDDLPFGAEPLPSPRDEILENALAGTTIGPCHLIEEVGRGGLGVVYRARQEEGGIQREVALKIIKRGQDTDEVLRRFELERQILAKLQHPNIATLHSAGVTEDGLSYFVMEFIDGTPIDEYCDQRKLTTTERLHLFRKVCAAVEYAHRRLIIHRDLKPSNILVTEEGEPKLLDFGIAKLLKKDGAESIPLLTTAGGAPMTPEYASPEQIQGEDLTTGSDVYSLGVVLYELLAGRRPYRLAARVQRAIEEAILEARPTAPSAAVLKIEEITTRNGTTTLTPESVASTRDGDSRRLVRRLSGDLDKITLMALRKEPERRYGSPDKLSDDIGRHLDGLPVEAQTDSFFYRTGKFVRRNRGSVSGAAVFVLLILGFAVSMYLQQKVTAQERDRAERVSDFLITIFESADPVETEGRDVPAVDLVKNAVTTLKWELRDEPRVRAEYLGVLGQVYTNLGKYDQAGELFKENISALQAEFGDRHPSTIKSKALLGDIFRRQGEYDLARELFTEVLSARESALGDAHPLVAEILSYLGGVATLEGSYDEAEELHQKAITIYEAIPEPDGIAFTESLDGLATALQAKGDYDESEQLFRRSLQIRQEKLGTHPDVAGAFNNLGLLLFDQGKFSEAESVFISGAKMMEKTFGRKHPRILDLLNNLALNYKAQARYDEAEALHLETLEIFEENFDENHPNIGKLLQNFAALYKEQKRFDEAGEMTQRAISIKENTLGTDHPSYAASLLTLASLNVMAQRFREAEDLYLQALQILRNALGEKHPNYVVGMNNFAWSYMRQQRWAEAEPIQLQVVGSAEKAFGSGHPNHASALKVLSYLYQRQGRLEEAELYLRKTLEIRLEALGLEHPKAKESVQEYTMLLEELGRDEEAGQLREKYPDAFNEEKD